MYTTPVYVTDDVKQDLIRASATKYVDAVACLCMNNETGVATMRIIRDTGDPDPGQNIVQIIDVSETDAYGSYIDMVVEPEDRVVVPGHPEMLAVFEDGGDAWRTLSDEFVALTALTEYIDPCDPDNDGDLQGDWDIWAQRVIAGGFAHTLDDAGYLVWEYIVADIEENTQYIVTEA